MEYAMSFKRSLPWDLEKAMTAFQVTQDWYEEYWLRGGNDLIDQDVHRRADGSIDVDFYERANREREVAMRQACVSLVAMLVRLIGFAVRRFSAAVKSRLDSTGFLICGSRHPTRPIQFSVSRKDGVKPADRRFSTASPHSRGFIDRVFHRAKL
jgi:hypothetical protein